MKRSFLLALMCFAALYQAQAQETVVKRTRTRLDESTIVQDSTGKPIKFKDWQALMMSGDYTLKRINPADTTSAYTLSKMSAEMKSERAAHAPKPPESPYFNTGGTLELLRDKAIDGFSVDPKALIGKIVVLNFWFVDCPPCRMEIPELNKVADAYKDNPDVVFIAIGLDTKSQINKFTATTPFNYHLVANSMYWTNKWGIRSFPTNVVIDRQGIVRFHASGYGPGTAVWIKKSIDEIK